ncbi:MAG: GTP cyclohydrolase I [Candidatus Thorarchaeota archaeon]
MKEETLVRKFFERLGIQLTDEAEQNTPKRYVRTLKELTSGYHETPPKLKTFSTTITNQVVHIGNIKFATLCEHHLVPFEGTVDVWYVPNGKIIGLSKPARLVDWLSRRLNLQERLTHELLEHLWEALEPEMMLVVVKAAHGCSRIRGPKSPNEVCTTYEFRFKNAQAKRSWLNLIQLLIVKA